MLDAFWRVALSLRFRVRAIFAAGVFLRASVFSSRTCTEVHERVFERLFVPFFMRIKPPCMSAGAFRWKVVKRKAPRT
jgi:hypothetical protein